MQTITIILIFPIKESLKEIFPGRAYVELRSKDRVMRIHSILQLDIRARRGVP